MIAFGVVYNAARISLSERARELASLRVLGFTKAEVSYILLGELTVLTPGLFTSRLSVGIWPGLVYCGGDGNRNLPATDLCHDANLCHGHVRGCCVCFDIRIGCRMACLQARLSERSLKQGIDQRSQWLKTHQKANIAKDWLLGLALAVLMSLLFFALRPQPVNVDLAGVTEGPMMVSIQDEGQTRVREIYTVSAPIAGRALRIEADAGDPVEAFTTVLASIEPMSPTFLDVRTRAQAESAVKAAEAAQTLAAAEVARAEAELEFAKSELSRTETLFKRRNVSQSALDRGRLEVRTRESALATANAALRVKDYELETAKASLIDPGNASPSRTPENCCIPIYAPVNGQVLQIQHESEGVVSAGTPLIDIGDPQELEVVVDLLSSDAVKVQKGAKAFLENWGGDRVLEAQVRRIEPFGFTKISALGIEEQRVNVVLDLTGPAEDWQALGHGFRVDTRIVTWQKDKVRHIPLGALFRDRDQWSVFVADNGTAVLRPVEVGQTNEVIAEILSGLELDERVILHPSDRISSGTRIAERQTVIMTDGT